MSSEFDPYRIWLGIPVSEQPANLYRLLGLALFESDDDVISNAADRQMAHVRTFQAGKYSEQSQKLLNELSAARVTLLDKKKKAEYDAKLKAEQDSTAGSSMVNLGNGAPPQGSFIGGQSSVNLAPPPINAPEGSLLGVNLGLSSTSKKKSGLSERISRDKSGKGSSTASGSKRAGSKKNSNTGLIAGIVCGAAVLLIAALFFMLNSSSKTVSEDDEDDYQSDFFQRQAQLTQAPQPQANPAPPKASDKQHRGERRNHKKDKKVDTSADDFALPPPTVDTSTVPTPASTEGEKTGSESPDGAAEEGADVPVDVTQLAQTPGQIKVYDKIQAKPIAASTLLTDVDSVPDNALRQSADSSHLLVGSSDSDGRASVVNIATGDVAFSFAPSTVGRFADCNEAKDKKMYFLAVNPSKASLMEYQSNLVSDDIISQADPQDFRPNSFIFRFDVNGQPVKETDSKFNAFVKFKGYQILQIASPVSADSGLMAVALSDGLVHVVNVESGSDFMRFYPSDSSAPIPVWTKDSIETAKKEKEKFKDLFKVIKPSVVPTSLVFQSEKYLASGNSQGEAFVWNVEEYAPVVDTTISSLQQLTHEFSAQESKSPVINMRFDSTGQNLYIFWADGHVGVWNWKNNQLVKKGFVEQSVKYAQILADKYLLVQNNKGEVSIWSWDSEKVVQVGIFKPLTELVIASPEQLLFWATERGASSSNLTMYALPTDFVEAMKAPEFARLFKTIIIYPVPEESKWKAKMAEANEKINKYLKDMTDEQKKAKIRKFVDKMQDSSTKEPELCYAYYMTLIQTMAQLKDKEQTLELVDSVLKEFDANKNELKLYAYTELLPQLKKNEALVLAKELLDLCESMLNNGGDKERIKEIARTVKKTCPEFEKRANVLIFKCNN